MKIFLTWLWHDFLDARWMIFSRAMWIIGGFAIGATVFMERDARECAEAFALYQQKLVQVASGCERFWQMLAYDTEYLNADGTLIPGCAETNQLDPRRARWTKMPQR